MNAPYTGVKLAIPAGTAVAQLSAAQIRLLLERGGAFDSSIVQTVTGMIDAVRTRGDAALREQVAAFDGVELERFEVSRALWADALEQLDRAVVNGLRDAASAIRAFHEAQRPRDLELEVQPGLVLGRRTEPLRRVGVYAPGGRAAYPSSVLMGVVPARVAGVAEVVVCSPAGPAGLPPASVLAACEIGGADRLFALGGAGAIAALALGTESVPRVDKIVGPGNAYVTEAKRQLTGAVGIDNPAGPSEILILADESADPHIIALELLAQAEHDPDAAVVLAATSTRLIEAVRVEIERLLPIQPRRTIIEAALAKNGALLLAADVDALFCFAERYAPEHLLLLLRDARALLPRVRAAGTVFVGAFSSVAFGDYLTGANHVLPTAGLARVYSGLSTQDFMRGFTWQAVDVTAAATLAATTAVLADAEGLPAHAAAARARAGTDAQAGGTAQDNSNLQNRIDAAADAATDSSARAHTTPLLRAAYAATDSGARAGTAPLLRAAYADIELYDPKRAPCEVDLSDNTNLFGVAPSVRAFLSAIPDARITRYPSVFATELKRGLADYFGVGPENIATGCGSDDVIDSALRAFCEPGDRIVYPEPTFGMVDGFARMNVLQRVPVALAPGLRLDAAALAAARPRVTYLCSPNNPTGTVFPREELLALDKQLPGIVLLDEAYADFADGGLAREVVNSRRMLSLRTLSKAFGVAGLRVGFAIGPAALIVELEKSRGPYKVNAVAEAAALEVLRNDRDWVRAGIEQVRRNRARLQEHLAHDGVHVLNSGGNFLLMQTPAPYTAETLAGTLRAKGVAVRAFPALPHLGDCIRVSIGPWELMERFLEELRAR